MKLQFDANQEYQISAIDSVVDVFRGQPVESGGLRLEQTIAQEGYLYGSEFVVGNNLTLADETILKNLQDVQKRNDIEPADGLDGLNFSVEMETGTGKTYVYLRTIHELHNKYGFKKFIIVVPSLAIKEGVIKNLQITKEHFGMLYENPEMDFYVYDPKKRGDLKNFATANSLQILVINIDSFAKFSEQKAGQNIIYQESDWGVPIEYIQGVNPIVVVDEPQNMETPKRRQAIENLNPLCTLRYSATHKYHYNLVYKLDPVRAYDKGLVKKIEVDSVVTQDSFNDAFIELKSVQAKKTTVSAKLKIDVNDKKGGIKRKPLSVRIGDDLFEKSNKREIYQDGYIVNEIDVAGE
jgi:type III restriction enzyme